MQTRTLGRSGIRTSALGLGCWAIGGPMSFEGRPMGGGASDDGEAIRALRRAMELGVNFFDTSDMYGCGHSERLIAQAVAGRRREVVIATKFGMAFDEARNEITGERADPEYIRQACEASLRRLRTDYIDLYQFHLGVWKDGASVRDTLEDLAAEGKILWYGWSTDDPDCARVFAQGAHCCAIQQRLNVFEGDERILAVCEAENLASINRYPLARGIVSGKFSAASAFPADDARHKWNLKDGREAGLLRKYQAIRDILTAGGRSGAQGALCWLWARSAKTIPIPGFKTVAQIEDNAGAMRFDPLTPAQLAEIAGLLSSAT